MPLENLKLNRREFLKLAGATAASTLSLSTFIDLSQTATAADVVNRYTLPNSVSEVKLEKIIDALASGKTIGEGDYVPDFANIVNYAHKELTAITYQNQMEINFHNKNPIEIIILEKLQNEKGISNYFSYTNEPGKVNRVFVDSNLKPLAFMNLLPTLLAYSILGHLDLAVNAHAHRDVSYIVARFPELIREKDSECIFMERMMSYVGEMKYINGRHAYKTPNFHFAYMVFLNRRLPTQEVIDVNNAINFSISGGTSLYQNLLKEALFFLQKRKAGYVIELIENFTRKTRQYILQQNPNMPQVKKDLLNKKIEIVKNILKTVTT